MFCYKCGTQIPDNSKFCSSCGAQINIESKPEPVVAGGIVMCPTCHQTYNAFHNTSCPHCSGVNRINLSKVKFDTKTIICLIVAAVMLLSMLVLPMFTVKSSQTISLLGDNYFANKSIQKTINTLSRIAFIFLLAATAAIVVFRITKKTRYSFISSCVNGGILFLYIGGIVNAWTTTYSEAPITPGAGTVLCLGCSIALFVLSFLEFKKEKENNKPKSPTPPQPMIFR